MIHDDKKDFTVKRLLFIVFSVCMLSFFSTGCALHPTPEEKTTALLKSPEVNDLYAARVDYFSNYEYGDGGAAFGVLKIIEVTPEQLMLQSSLAANIDKDMALQLLQKKPSEIDWDKDELIKVLRSDLLRLFDDGMIVEARRPKKDTP